MTDLIAELAEVVRLIRKDAAGAGQWGLPSASVNFLRTHHAEIEAMARDAARYQRLKDADVWSDEVWHAIDERDSDGLDEALDAMHDSAREDSNG